MTEQYETNRMWREHDQAVHNKAREDKTADINRLSEELGFRVQWLSPYQCRINNYLDIYLKAQTWHCIKNNTRGYCGYLSKFITDNIETINKYETDLRPA